jgi:nitroreductase
MKTLLKKIWRVANITFIGLNDIVSYVRFSQSVFNTNKKIALEAAITRRYHGLEKGLSVTVAKRKFGEKTIIELLDLLDRYINTYGETNNPAVESSIIALNEYVFQNATTNDEIIEKINTFLDKDIAKLSREKKASTLTFTRDYLQKCATKNFEELCSSRYSIREYTDTPIPTEKLLKAIAMSQKSPSACNRQSVRAHYSCDKDKINLLNKFKPGNKGFSNINTVIIITTDYQTHDLPQERHQGFVEAGMFAMTLIYHLHSMGFGTCALHSSFTPSIEKQLKSEFKIVKNEALCLMISVGNLQEKISVPNSCRYPLHSICSSLDA